MEPNPYKSPEGNGESGGVTPTQIVSIVVRVVLIIIALVFILFLVARFWPA